MNHWPCPIRFCSRNHSSYVLDGETLLSGFSTKNVMGTEIRFKCYVCHSMDFCNPKYQWKSEAGTEVETGSWRPNLHAGMELNSMFGADHTRGRKSIAAKHECEWIFWATPYIQCHLREEFLEIRQKTLFRIFKTILVCQDGWSSIVLYCACILFTFPPHASQAQRGSCSGVRCITELWHMRKDFHYCWQRSTC